MDKLSRLYRAHDPAKGSFDPTPREPQDGKRHKDKTAQDRMKPENRERYKDAQRRLAKAQQK